MSNTPSIQPGSLLTNDLGFWGYMLTQQQSFTTVVIHAYCNLCLPLHVGIVRSDTNGVIRCKLDTHT